MAVDPLMLTRFADQPHYRVLSNQAYDPSNPPIPSLDYKASLALQFATRKGVAFEKFDESYAAGKLHDRDELSTGFGVADARGRAAGAARTRGIPPASDEDLLAALGDRPGAAAIGDEHLAAGSGAFVGRPRVRRIHRADLPPQARPRAAPADSDDEDDDAAVAAAALGGTGSAEPCAAAAARSGLVGTVTDGASVLRATRTLPVQARLAGFELLPGEEGRAPTVVQAVPGLLTPSERRLMLSAEVAQGKAERARRKVLADRARRAALLARRHPVGALGIGGVGAVAAAAAGADADGDGVPDSYQEAASALAARAAAAEGHRAARRLALMRVGNSVARRGYDLVAPARPRDAHPDADELRRSTKAGSAREGARGGDSFAPGATLRSLGEAGDYRSGVRAAAEGKEAPAAAGDGGSKVFSAKGRVVPPSQVRQTSHNNLFPKPDAHPERWARRTQRLLDQRTRGRDFDIVTGRRVPPRVAPSAEAVAVVGRAESLAIAPGAAAGRGRTQREAHPSLAATRTFVDR